MDPRLRAAVDASVRWYDDIFAVHRIPVTVRRAVWSASGAAPPWHSAVKTLAPEAGMDDVLHAIEPHDHGTVADSFGGLDLAAHGFDLLFEATWLHRPPDPVPPVGLPMGWSVGRGHRRARRVEPAPRDHGGAGPRAARPSALPVPRPARRGRPHRRRRHPRRRPHGRALERLVGARPPPGLAGAPVLRRRAAPRPSCRRLRVGRRPRGRCARRGSARWVRSSCGLVEQRVRLERRPPVVVLAARPDELEARPS